MRASSACLATGTSTWTMLAASPTSTTTLQTCVVCVRVPSIMQLRLVMSDVRDGCFVVLCRKVNGCLPSHRLIAVGQ